MYSVSHHLAPLTCCAQAKLGAAGKDESSAISPGVASGSVADAVGSDGYWFSVEVVFERWLEGYFVKLKLNGEGLRVRRVHHALLVPRGDASGMATSVDGTPLEEPVDGTLEVELRLLEGPKEFKQVAPEEM